MDYSFLIGVHQVDATAESGGVRHRNFQFFLLCSLFKDRTVLNPVCTPGGRWNVVFQTIDDKIFEFSIEQTSVQPKRMMYSTPMDTIQVEFDEHNKPDDHLVKYVNLLVHFGV